MLRGRIGVCTLVFLLFVRAVAQTTVPPQPHTPSEAAVFLQEQLDEAGQSGKLEGIEEKQKRRAAEYASLFKNKRWQGKELLSLAGLFLTAEQYPNAEKVSLEYLKSPAAVEAKRARTNLLSAYLGQKKLSDALAVAETLLDEKVYDFDLVSGVQRLIEALRPDQPRQAITLAEKMLPNSFAYFQSIQSRRDLPPVLAAQQIGAAYEYGSIYRELGESAKAGEYAAAFIRQYNAKSLASNKVYQKALDAAMLRAKVYDAPVPPLEILDYIDAPQLNLPELKGKVVMLDFFAHWCVECIQGVPSINALQEKYGAGGLVVLGVTKYYGFFGERQGVSQSEELAALKSLKAQLHLKYGLVVTGPKVEERYGVAALPTIVLIDQKGMVRLIDTGYNERRIEKVIANLINEAGGAKSLRP
jgi:thiol-disulfide isomerase/thioredoxin